MSKDARGIVADSTMNDRTAVTPYQAGQHRPALWQADGHIYAVAKLAPAGTCWMQATDQTYAARASTVLWERGVSLEEDEG